MIEKLEQIRFTTVRLRMEHDALGLAQRSDELVQVFYKCQNFASDWFEGNEAGRIAVTQVHDVFREKLLEIENAARDQLGQFEIAL